MWLNLVAGIPDLATFASMGGLFLLFFRLFAKRNACVQERHEPCRHTVLVLVAQDLDQTLSPSRLSTFFSLLPIFIT